MPSASPQGKEFSEGAESSPTSPLKKEETPLTMAMRQAGAEAAKKAGERKGLMSRARPSTKTSEATDIPMPAVEAKMAKSAEEPGASAETTAAKIPEKLAEEGAKRTSVDKIAEEGVKRTSMEGATESDSISQQEQVGISKEASNLEARRASSITKLKSPLSTETAARSSTELGASSMESNPETHRGSSVSLASKEEIQGIEKRDAIPEETEEANESAEQAEAQDDEALPTVKAETAGGDSDNATLSGVTASDEAELSATKGVKPQEDNAREAAGASTSVGD